MTNGWQSAFEHLLALEFAASWQRLMTLRDYNTRVVLVGMTLLGGAGGLVGTFTLLRKRALMADALSHATLPGIALAFLAATVLGGEGKSLPLLLTGAGATGLLGVGVILGIRRYTRIKEDAALGIVLSVFFGLGMTLLTMIQQMEQGHAAGLESFIYGKTASLRAVDAYGIAAVAAASIGLTGLLFKEFKLLCFDETFGAAHGLPTRLLDALLMALVVLVLIVGLQAVGLILMVALLVIPAAAARFWTDRMGPMSLIAAMLGSVGGAVGAATSALFSDLPSGAVIVLVCAGFFGISLFGGTRRGVFIRLLRRYRLNRSIDRQHLLRDLYEVMEATGALTSAGRSALPLIPRRALFTLRTWPPRRLERTIRRADAEGLVVSQGDQVALTARGLQESARLTRRHRLWELYLITHADVAPGRVDRDADAIEHVLEPEVVAELEALLDKGRPEVPASPHELSKGADR